MFTSVSPSRTYVAMCHDYDSTGYYFKKFILPENRPNDSGNASWYFLNKLDLTASIEGCFAIEAYNNLTDAKMMFA